MTTFSAKTLAGEPIAVGVNANEEAVIKKISRRLLGFLFILYCFSYLDRINIGFAALSMNKDLGLTATTFGIANAIFYIGYMVCEIPSNLVLERVGARKWLARIMVTWGIASALTMFAVGPNSLYVVRCLVGIAEAGFLPGILLYLTYWFPAVHRARANAMLMIAMPFTSALGSIMSGFILQLDKAWGFAGWQWLFFLEGAPTILLGVITYYFLTDKPENATWLTSAEKSTLRTMLADAPKPERPHGFVKAFSLLPLGTIIALAVGYFCLVLSLNASATWTPQIMKSIHPEGSMITIGLLTSIPAIFTILLMIFWSRRSDRSGERKWHIILPMLMAAIGCLMTGYSIEPVVRMIGVIVTAAGAFTAMTIFWTVPAARLTVENRALGIALISTIGVLGSATSPVVFGILKDITHSFSSGLLFTAVMLAVGALVIFSMKIPNVKR